MLISKRIGQGNQVLFSMSTLQVVWYEIDTVALYLHIDVMIILKFHKVVPLDGSWWALEQMIAGTSSGKAVIAK